MIKSGFLDTSRKPLFHAGSVGKNGDLVGGDLGDQVNDPSDKVANTGEGAKQTRNKGNNIFCLNKAYDAVDTANDTAQNQLKKDLDNLGQRLVSGGDAVVCHGKLLSPTGCDKKTAVGADRGA